MAPNASLSISSLISVLASLQAAATQAANTQSLLVLTETTLIDPVSRKMTFTSAAAVAQYFGSNTAVAAAAIVWFGQTPQPTSMQVGLWAQNATSGMLVGSPLTSIQQASLLTTLQAISNGSLTISLNGTSHNLTSLNFSAILNLNGAAAVLQTALAALVSGSTCVWNPTLGCFVITSGTTGTSSTVSFATLEGTGTDVGLPMGLQQITGNGAYEANGIAAETALAAATLFDANYGQTFYGLMIIGAADADHQAVQAFIAASANKHFYWVSTQEAGAIVAASTTDIAYLLGNASAAKVAVQYSGSSPYAVLSLAALMQTVDYNAENSVIAAMYGVEPGITADNLNATQLAALIAKNANGYVGYNDGSSIIQPGVCSSGQWIDLVIGADALVLAVQQAVWNLFKNQHVPQDDSGMHMINVTIAAVMKKFVTNGYIGPGTWYGNLFGALQNNPDGTPPYLSAGYYIYQPLVATQSQTQKGNRISVPFQIAANLRGAVGSASVQIGLIN